MVSAEETKTQNFNNNENNNNNNNKDGIKPTDNKIWFGKGSTLSSYSSIFVPTRSYSLSLNPLERKSSLQQIQSTVGKKVVLALAPKQIIQQPQLIKRYTQVSNQNNNKKRGRMLCD